MKTSFSVALADNETGFRHAVEQVRVGALKEGGWHGHYDKDMDILVMRLRGRDDFRLFYAPHCPEIHLCLDKATGELVGIDLLDFERVLLKKAPFAAVLQPSELKRRWWRRLHGNGRPTPPPEQLQPGILGCAQAC